MSRSPYELLGLARDCTQADIKRSFLRKIKQVHPDKDASCDSQQTTIALIEAYRLLSDPEQKAIFDQKVEKSKSFKHGYLERQPLIRAQCSDFINFTCNQCECDNQISISLLREYDAFECKSCNYNILLTEPQ